MSVTNIVRAVVKPGSDYTVTSSIMKEDTGQILLIEGLELPEVYEIDFSNDRHHGTSVTMIGNAEGVLIPTQFIKTGRDVFAFYYYVGDGFGQTEHIFRLPNDYRPDRTDEIPDPEEESKIDQAIAALNIAVAQTAQSAQTSTQKALEASESAQSASISEQNAANSAETAVNAENAAERYANDARSYKEQAASSASSANVSANTASVKASEASTSSVTASVKADEARASAASASNDAGIASTAAGSANSAASRAEQAKEDTSTFAQRSANSAQASADYSASAQTSATASAQSASQSAQIKADVEDLVDDAQGYAQASAQSASASANSASDAQGYANSASASAQSASGYASSAQTSAQTASAKASEASTSASTASTKASESAQSASQALSYKTDAESAKTASQTAQGLAESARDSAISAKNDAESARDEAQNLVDGISGKAEQIDSNTERIESLEEDRYKPYVVDSASGAIASFPDGADDLPLKSLVVDINPVQDLSNGDPSPTNICPISGWTGMQLAQTGKNLFDEANATIYKRYFQSVTGGYVWTTSPDSSSYVFKCMPNTTYTLKPNNSNVTMFRVATINVSIEESENATLNQFSVASNPRTITTDSDATYIVIQMNNTIVSVKETQLQIELGDSATAYEPYNGTLIPINWQTEAGTVYGGHLDVLSGELVIDRAMVDLGTLYYGYDSVHKWFVVRKSDAKGAKKDRVNANIISDMYTVYPRDPLADDLTIDNAVALTSSSFLIIRNLNYTNTSDFKSAVSGVQLCYELATPIEIQLSANQINSLLGVNNIWADSGDTEVEYRADTKLYIERLTAPDSADMIADSAITSGQFFMIGNSLYRALANIASGATITVGTNAQRVSLSDALNLVNA